MLYTLLTLILALWLIGFLAHFGGSFIHLLLLVAGILFVVQLLSGRTSV
jgi:hypothetical protein